MENITSFYCEARYDVQDAHFPEDIPEELWELWYRQATAGDRQLHQDSKDMLRALKKKLLSLAPLERLQRLFRLRPTSAKSEL